MNPQNSNNQEFKRKNDYSIVAWQGSRKMHQVNYNHKIYDYTNYLERNNIQWSCIRVYARRSGRYLRSFYRKYDLGNIPARHDGWNSYTSFLTYFKTIFVFSLSSINIQLAACFITLSLAAFLWGWAFSSCNLGLLFYWFVATDTKKNQQLLMSLSSPKNRNFFWSSFWKKTEWT